MFSSSLRNLKRDDIANIWDFTYRFLVDQDAFDPGIDFGYFLGRWRQWRCGPGPHRIVNPGFTFVTANGRAVSIPPIDRVDYLALVAPRAT